MQPVYRRPGLNKDYDLTSICVLSRSIVIERYGYRKSVKWRFKDFLELSVASLG